MKTTILTKSFEETQAFAQQFAPTIKGGDVLLLYGELGAGKTTFMQGLAKGLGVSQRIISPTFIIMRTYNLPGNNIKYLYHIDLYRTQSETDLEGLGIPEVLRENDGISAIEWPEKLGNMLPGKRIDIHFTSLSEEERKIEIEYVG